MNQSVTKKSKFLSLVLRHNPGVIGLELEEGGWADVVHLLELLRAAGRPLSREELDALVNAPGKKRFEVHEGKIRAKHGHSVEVDLGITASCPPEILFHGTVQRNLGGISAQGLLPRTRLQVHLSTDIDMAQQVGRRYGSPVVLSVLAGDMHRDGHAFFKAGDRVWLTDHVPPAYIRRQDQQPLS
mmetsp:Transcript_1862/g.5614  ORF Transcript_1862/g.5614 Transcript_1862/m.5614 type:complete len:185 (+) Transcript_1862:139-693(+)